MDKTILITTLGHVAQVTRGKGEKNQDDHYTGYHDGTNWPRPPRPGDTKPKPKPKRR